MNKKLHLAIIIILAVAIIFSSFIILEPREHSKEIPETNFISSAQINLEANITNNSLYSSNHLYNPSIIYEKLLKNMTVYINANFLSSSKQTVFVYYSIRVISSSPSWSKVFNSNSSTLEFNGSRTISGMVIPLNLSYLYNQSAEIDNQLGYAGTAPTVDINVTVQDPVIGSSSSTYMRIIQGNQYYSLKYGNPASMTGTVDIKDAYGSKPVLGLPVLYGYIIIIPSAILLGFLAVTYIGIPKRKSNLELKLQEFGDRIIDIQAMPRGIVTKVDTFGELIKLSDAYHEPLFYIKKNSVFFVCHDFRNYVYSYSEVEK
jgi:hypothetical protein